MTTRLIFIFFLFASFLVPEKTPFLIVLGIAQDAGYPQVDCKKECCKKYQDKKMTKKSVSCLALFDPATNQKWIFDATPDFTAQLYEADKVQQGNLSGIFLTHAHIGHYTGLMYLGREGMNAKDVPVYVMPGMETFLENNGPWNQLIALKNIKLHQLNADSAIWLTDKISVTPLLVPHRDEYSETVGYSIKTNNKTVLFIPDIDKWEKWNRDIRLLINQFDYLFLDGTFYAEDELPGRNMAEVPHPFVKESISVFDKLPTNEKKRIFFIHFNHTNPLLDKLSTEYAEVKRQGFSIAVEKMKLDL